MISIALGPKSKQEKNANNNSRNNNTVTTIIPDIKSTPTSTKTGKLMPQCESESVNVVVSNENNNNRNSNTTDIIIIFQDTESTWAQTKTGQVAERQNCGADGEVIF